MNIILASSSPRRTEILKLANIIHKVIPSTCKEVIEEGLKPIEVVQSLSYQKANNVFQDNKDSLIIGADTIVTIDNKILGKPHNEKEALEMLELLSGRTHEVITGVTIINKNIHKTFYEITEVTVAKLSKKQIIDYINSEYIYDKAGSYAVQGEFCKYIDKINGDYYNVVGLPISRIYKELKEFDYEI